MSDALNIPRHVGIVLDGNRRWAKAHSLPALEGHRQGSDVFKKISLEFFDKGVSYVSAFVFSTENWQRTQEEISYLMKLVIKAVELHLDEFHKNGVRIKILGKRDGLDKKVLESIVRTEEKTAMNNRATLALCFNYGGKQEIVDAVNELISSGVKSIDQEMISQSVYCSEIPAVDLLIRTSGEQRTSGFMLWRSDYAEMLFIDKMWPDFSSADVDMAIKEYSVRQRRFGK